MRKDSIQNTHRIATLAATFVVSVLLCLFAPATAQAAPTNPISGTYASSAQMLANPYALSSLSISDNVAVSPQYVDKQGCNCIFVPNPDAMGEMRVSFNFMNASGSPAGAPSRRDSPASPNEPYIQEQSLRNVTFTGSAGASTIPVSENFSTDNVIDLRQVLNLSLRSPSDVLTIAFDDPNAPKTITYLVVACNGTDNVFVTSNDIADRSRAWVDYDKNNKAPARLSMTGTYNEPMLSNLSVDSIKARGNSTFWGTHKKSYRVKFDERIDMTGQGHPAKKWNLIGMPYDHTLVRDTFSYEFAEAIGLSDSPQCRLANLYYDGEYRGAYMICETMSSGNGRYGIGDPSETVEDANPKKDLDNLTAFPRTAMRDENQQDVMGYVDNVRDPRDLKTGYLVELDNLFYYDENCWFRISSGETFALKEPECASKRQVEFVRDLFQEAYECMEAGGIHPVTHKRLSHYIDMESFAKFFYLQELAKNVDAFTTSTYFYIPEGETRIYAGPIWDMDDAFGSDMRDPSFSMPEGYITTHSMMVKKLLGCADFQAELLQYHGTELRDATKQALTEGGLLDQKLAEASAYVTPNYMVWGFETQGERFFGHDSYEQAVESMRVHMNARFRWLDAHMTWKDITSNKSDPGYMSAAKAFKYTHTSYYRAKWCS